MSWTSRLKKAVGGSAAEAEPRADARTDAADVARTLSPVEEVDPKSLSAEEIVALLTQDLLEINQGKLAPGEIDPAGHIFDYGYVDSLSAVVFLVRIEERFGVQIEDVELIETVTDLNAVAARIRGDA